MFCPPTLLLHSATPSGSLVSEAGSDSWGGGGLRGSIQPLFILKDLSQRLWVHS